MAAERRTRWGRETDLAIANFQISAEPMPIAIVRAVALIKGETAAVNEELGVIDARLARAIEQAASEVTAGAFDDQFPVDVFQTGSGTSTNMNVNEVIADRAAELCGRAVHPNDHVNASQSSNDVFPSAIRIAAATGIDSELLPSLAALESALGDLSERHADTVKLGRTHLVDAVPMTFGQEVSAWARAIALGRARLAAVMPRLLELPIGGTAVGTGLNAPARFGELVAAGIARRTGLAFVEAENHFEAQSAQDVLLEVSGACKVVALSLHKVAGDLRLLASGPDAGLAELTLAPLQAGSSIMPGKVNPVICEAVQQVAAQVVGNDAAITFAATASTLQLNTAMPVMARALTSSITLLRRAADSMTEKVLPGMQVDVATMRRFAESASALVTALSAAVGYDAAARIAATMRRESRTLADVLATEGLDVDIEDLDLVGGTAAAGHGYGADPRSRRSGE